MKNKQYELDVKDRILKAARELFVQNGYNGTSIRDIATAADANIAMVNYYFGSKENLFSVVLGDVFNILSEKIFTLIDADLPFFELLRKWIYSYYDVLMQYPDFPLFVLNEAAQNPKKIGEKFRLANSYQVYAKLVLRIHSEEEKGTIREVSIPDFLINVLSLSVFPFVSKPVVTQFLNLPEKEYMEQINQHREYVANFIINAIKKENQTPV
ncbi:MAG: TetR/AcrR family transcriptional regulator [Prevotellaceae bacterium]|jgi:AcrR family transcriptional regulator|nr:TetR/AcrR family transcriptional regulator [Prevotellaceae bacterium]